MEILYFSHAGEHLIDGKPSNEVRGNTEILAGKIAKQLDIPLKRITAKQPYPSGYRNLVERAKVEHAMNLMPEFELEKSIQDPVLMLGYPIWFGELPNLVKNYLKHRQRKPQVIYPFCTSEGSGMGNSEESIKQIFPEVELKLGLTVRGSRVKKADCAVEHWLKQLDLKGEYRNEK